MLTHRAGTLCYKPHMNMRHLVSGLPVVLCLAVPLLAAEPSATAVVCTAVKDRAPVGAADHFPATVGQLYCFSELKGVSGQVHHVWFHGDKQVGDVELTAKGERWRTWSAKKVPAAWKGDWRVEVRAADGKVLATASFKIE